MVSPALAGAQKVSVELVFAVDVSLSVNDIEYRLQMRGMAAAFGATDIGDLIASHPNGIAVLVTQWSGVREAAVPLPWTRLTGRDDAAAYGTELATVPRSNQGNFTALGQAISFAIDRIETNDFAGEDRKIDISGDGRNNSGPEPLLARLDAVSRGMTINGLAIEGQEPDVAGYYRNNVMAGPEAFVVTAKGFEDFAMAFKRKLKRELSPRIALIESGDE